MYINVSAPAGHGLRGHRTHAPGPEPKRGAKSIATTIGTFLLNKREDAYEHRTLPLWFSADQLKV